MRKKYLVRVLALLISIGLMTTCFAASPDVTVVVQNAKGEPMQNVPVVVDGTSVYRTDEDGTVILPAKSKTIAKVPPVYKDKNNQMYDFPVLEFALKTGEKKIFKANPSTPALEESLEEGLYRAVKKAASGQKAEAFYWFDPPISQPEIKTAMSKAIDNVRRDFPEYYLSNLNDLYYSSFAGNGKYDIGEYKLTYFLTDNNKKQQVEKKISEIVNQIPKKTTNYEKIKIFHDFIINNCAYDEAALNGNSDKYPNAFNAYGVFVEKKAVCEGYAFAFKMLCDRANIDSYVVTGTSNNSPHAWNYVKLDGEYYLVDCTMDDQMAALPGYDYFLIGSDKSIDMPIPDGSQPGVLAATSYKNK